MQTKAVVVSRNCYLSLEWSHVNSFNMLKREVLNAQNNQILLIWLNSTVVLWSELGLCVREREDLNAEASGPE